MHAIIRQGDGKYYISAVFGYYKDVKSEDDYQRYLERIHSPYYVVLDENKTHLIKWFAMKPNTKYLIPQILIVDSDQKGWVVDDEGVGGVDFLSREDADKYISDRVVPEAVLKGCREMENSYEYNEYPEILTSKDIKNFDWASDNFHDACIEEQKILNDGSLYLKFGGNNDPYWYGSTVILKDGFVYFVDEDEMTVEEITDGYCWFKARHMKYHIIPD